MLNVAAHMMACRRRRVAAGVVDPPMGVRLCPGDDRPCHEHGQEGTCAMLSRRTLSLNMMTCTRCREAASGACPSGSICLCPDDGGPIAAHASAGECPRGLLLALAPLAPERHDGWGPKMWAEIHTKQGADQAYVDAIIARLPCGPCKRNWPAVLAKLPPVFGEGWFARTVEWHNAVNVERGVPEMPLEDATKKWRAN